MGDYEILLELEKKLNKTIGKIEEKHLFKLLKETVLPSLIPTDNTYSRWDCLIKDGAVELKCRRTHYLTLRIEKDKYDSMKQFNKKYYINSTNCGIYLFDLDKINPVWEQTLNPSTTYWDKTKKLKWTYDIPLRDGRNITRQILNKLNNLT